MSVTPMTSPHRHPNTRWRESERSRESCTVSHAGSGADEGDRVHDYDSQDEELDQVSELGHRGVDSAGCWSEASPTRSVSPMQRRRAGCHGSGERGFAGASSLPLDVGNASVTSWDASSEPTVGTDAGTDHDIAAASGLPEGESDDDEEDDDEFEAADSLDLGAVALCVSGVACV